MCDLRESFCSITRLQETSDTHDASADDNHCLLCEKNFSRPDALKRHMETHLKDTAESVASGHKSDRIEIESLFVPSSNNADDDAEPIMQELTGKESRVKFKRLGDLHVSTHTLLLSQMAHEKATRTRRLVRMKRWRPKAGLAVKLVQSFTGGGPMPMPTPNRQTAYEHIPVTSAEKPLLAQHT
jgi:hypothetical protein